MSGYDEYAEHVGARSFTRTWRVKLAVFAVFVAAVGVSVGLSWIAR